MSEVTSNSSAYPLSPEELQELVNVVTATCQQGPGVASDQAALRDALSKLSKYKFETSVASRLRIEGFPNCLVRLMDPSWEAATSMLAVTVSAAICRNKDLATRDLFVREGASRKLLRLLDPRNPDVCVQAVILLQLLVNAPSEKMAVVEELFRGGTFAKLTRLLDPSQEGTLLLDRVCVLLQSTSNLNSSSVRERLRDLGLIDILIALARSNPKAHARVSALYNMSRSESLHTSFKESQFLQLVQELMALPLLSKTHVVCLLAVAHIYGGDDAGAGGGAGGGAAAEAAAVAATATAVLNSMDPSRQLVEMMEAVVHGDGLYSHSRWDAEEVIHGVQSLARSSKHAAALVQASFPKLLIEVLADTDKRWAAAPDVHLRACRAALNLASHPPLVQPLLDAGLAAALVSYQRHEDMRIVDAARGCLLALGQLADEKAVAAAEQNAAVAGGGATAEGESHVGGGGGGAGTSGAPDGVVGDGGGGGAQFDVFLSHKRSDAKDFARALYNLLVLRGISTFLDFEFREELSDLDQIVARCRNLVFILTDNVFDSPWCMLELATAVRHHINIILVVKEGSRWKNSEGLKVCEFPPYELINTLPDGVRHIFSRKAVTHSDEYYQAFVELLLSKVKRSGEPGRQPEGRKEPLPPPAHPYGAPPVTHGTSQPAGQLVVQLHQHQQSSPAAHPAPRPQTPPPHTPQPQQQQPLQRQLDHTREQHQHHHSSQATSYTYTVAAAASPISLSSPSPQPAGQVGGSRTSGGPAGPPTSATTVVGAVSSAAHPHLSNHSATWETPGAQPSSSGLDTGTATAQPAPPPSYHPGESHLGSASHPPCQPGGAGPGLCFWPGTAWPDAATAAVAAAAAAAAAAGAPGGIPPWHPSAGMHPASSFAAGGHALMLPFPQVVPPAAAAAAAGPWTPAGHVGAVAAVTAAVEALQAGMQQVHRDLGTMHHELSRTAHDLATDSARDLADLRRELAAHSRDTAHALMGLSSTVETLALQMQRLTALPPYWAAAVPAGWGLPSGFAGGWQLGAVSGLPHAPTTARQEGSADGTAHGPTVAAGVDGRGACGTGGAALEGGMAPCDGAAMYGSGDVEYSMGTGLTAHRHHPSNAPFVAFGSGPLRQVAATPAAAAMLPAAAAAAAAASATAATAGPRIAHATSAPSWQGLQGSRLQGGTLLGGGYGAAHGGPGSGTGPAAVGTQLPRLAGVKAGVGVPKQAGAGGPVGRARPEHSA